MEPVTVLGAGGHGQDVAAILQACGRHFAGYLDDKTGDPWSTLSGDYVFGVHSSVVRARRDNFVMLAASAIHPSAFLDPSVEVEAGVVVGPRAVIGNGCHIGRHVHIGQGATMVRTWLARYATVSPGAVICGDVHIAEGATIGAGAVVSNLCEVGEYATVGAGAVLPPRTVVPPHSVWVGVPARPIREEAA